MGVAFPTIVHLDADAFFVSVELAARPELRGRKVAVGGRERGIISSASYEARACGVYTPMPTSRALRVCPDLVLLPHRGDYGEVSRRMFARCEELTPWVERCSIDEGYLDLGPCGFRDGEKMEAAVRGLQAGIGEKLGIPVSFGIAANKLVAQIASKLRKPRGFVVVGVGEEERFLAPLEVGRLPGVGAKTEAALKARGVCTAGDLVRWPEAELQRLLGAGWRGWWEAARGVDDRRVETEREEPKSFSQQETFAEDTADGERIERVLKGMIDALMPRIRSEGKRARTLTVKVRHTDFTQVTAARSLPEATDLEGRFYPLLASLLGQAWAGRRRLRLVGLKLSGLEEGGRQLDLFTVEQDAKRRKLAAVLDRLNNREGEGLLVKHAHQLEGKRLL